LEVSRQPKDGKPGTPAGDLKERQQGMINTYLESIGKDPDNVELLNKLAWLLATGDNPDAGAIDRALLLAEKANALTKGQHAGVLDTVGAAYARSGRFDIALNAARAALKLAQANKETDLAAALERRIKLYERGEPMKV
jgi:tetratricopeptide (TPR) repeat protein